MENPIHVAQKDQVATVTLNRPEKLNALSPEMISELEETFKRLGDTPDIRTVVLTGAGNNFCAGVDVKGREYNPLNSREFLKKFNTMLKTIEMIPQPTIAMIRGNAVSGGLELALACTFRIAAETSVLGLPEIKLGLVVAGGATYRLPRLVGFGRAMEMCLMGESITGKQARECRLVNYAVEESQLEDKTREIAQKLAGSPPIAVSLVKDAMYSAAAPHVDTTALMEILSASVNHYTEDKKEGIKAFFEKRAPHFRGK
ncbi:MAG: enoyl-CoA hydratase/isomerase family protein [Desulfobacteraceae bacterium]